MPDTTAVPVAVERAETRAVAAHLHRRLEVAKYDLLGRAIQAAGTDSEGAVTRLLQRYYRDVAPEDLLGRDPVDILGVVVAHLRLAQTRAQGTALVHVFTPTVEEHGWASPHTVVQVVTDDMPFLVDSVSSLLVGQGRGVHLVVHPQFAVHRDLSGVLRSVIEGVDDPTGTIVESWIHVETDRETDPADIEALEFAIQRVLRDVREAVEDWPRMRYLATELAAELRSSPPTGVPTDETDEAADLLEWLAKDHFTFTGYREYDLVGEAGEEMLRGVPGTGLGILRADRDASQSFAKLPPQARASAREPRALVLTKANTRSTVHRPVYLDYVGVKRFDDAGNVIGERRFLGLFTSTAYTLPVSTVPVVRRKCAEVIARSGFRREGHSHKDLLQVLETYPRDELFQISVDELYDISIAVLHLQQRRQTRLFLRRDPYDRFVSVLVYLPRDRFNTTVRLRMEAVLREQFDSDRIDYAASVGESALARLNYVLRARAGGVLPIVDETELEALVVDATRSWTDDLAGTLLDQCGEERAAVLMKSHMNAFPEAYKEDFPARAAVVDLLALESLTDGDIAVNLYEPLAGSEAQRRFKVYRRGVPISLSVVLPVLSRMGVEVTDERPYELVVDGETEWIYDFGLRFDLSRVRSPDSLKVRFEEAFRAAWSGRLEVDGFNALVVAGGLDWRTVTVFRAYARYLRQTGFGFSQDYLELALVNNVVITDSLAALWTTRFDPEHRDVEREQALVDNVLHALDSVVSLDQDRIIRAFLALISATLRTNAYQREPDGSRHSCLSIKLDPSKVPGLPKPLPRFEIWVYSPRVEGVHLRFGRVARGGLRWSDRREDFRTEVLGLVKAQMVKNAVIVPVGAKGGFVAKSLPDPASDRDAWLAEGIACYRTFICGLLDITDNLVDGVVVPPADVIRHDGDDPYLVVAADKGTATFSDIANELALSRGFWLGDAFASGGSVGYDHKAMGITARGAWESVKRHFRELGVDTQTQDFTVAGIGDMSGDVFGNGMLLSEHIALVAAFDHRHVFLDPNPAPAASFAERRRLFDLPRSSWGDFDPSLISAGGGVHSRSAKSIPVTPQVGRSLGLPQDVTALTPAELMRAILQAPVDLLWNGGIGTYVKASSESDQDVGDKANDAIRVDGAELRCRVVGEGGNLGLTQLGRIEAAQSGVRLNTDAIDNSAGVDTSDHEVNIKVVLDAVVRSGDLTSKQRNEFLASMTDDVAHHVLLDNYRQNIALGNARRQAHALLTVHQRMITSLEAAGDLDRSIEFLPSDSTIDARNAAGFGLTSPELAVLLAYAKITLTNDIAASPLPGELWCDVALRSYFPHALVESYFDALRNHPLRQEIVTCVVVNEVINRGGITFAFRAVEETGAAPDDVVRAAIVTRSVFGLPAYWRRVEELDGQVPTDAQSALLLEARRLHDRSTRWLLQKRGTTIDVAGEIERFTGPFAELLPALPDLLIGGERDRLHRRTEELVAVGAPRDLALEASGLLDAYGLLDCVDVAFSTHSPIRDVAQLYFVLSERYEVDRLLTQITALPRGDRWSALARAALRSDLYVALEGMTRRVIATTPADVDVLERITLWEGAQAEGLARARATLDEIAALDTFDLATLSVALRTIRTLVAQSG